MAWYDYSDRGRHILVEAGTTPLPEHFSGRNANRSDLNSKTIENVYEIIENQHGNEAAQNYAQMVADIPSLSAYAFAKVFYVLECHDFQWNENMLIESHATTATRETALDATLDVLSDEKIQLPGLFPLFWGYEKRKDDATGYLRMDFLEKHSISIPEHDTKNIEQQYRNLQTIIENNN